MFDLVGDLGGVFEVLTGLLGIFLFPISQHSFILTASKILFKARTCDGSIFSGNRRTAIGPADSVSFELRKHYDINIRFSD